MIHHGMERVHDGTYGDGLINRFRKQDKPRIAVSVDILDTGVDIPGGRQSHLLQAGLVTVKRCTRMVFRGLPLAFGWSNWS